MSTVRVVCGGSPVGPARQTLLISHRSCFNPFLQLRAIFIPLGGIYRPYPSILLTSRLVCCFRLEGVREPGHYLPYAEVCPQPGRLFARTLLRTSSGRTGVRLRSATTYPTGWPETTAAGCAGTPIFPPRRTFRRLVKCYNADHRVRSFTCWEKFLAMGFVQLTYRESLRAGARDVIAAVTVFASSLRCSDGSDRSHVRTTAQQGSLAHISAGKRDLTRRLVPPKPVEEGQPMSLRTPEIRPQGYLGS